MMKKLILILFPLLAVVGIFYIKQQMNIDVTRIDNVEKKPLEFEDNKVQCPQCFMYLVGKKHTAQAIDEEHKTHFFDDTGCLILWIHDKKINIDTLKLWVYTLDTNEWVDMKKAYFSITEITPMEYGFGAYKNSADGRIDFDEMRLRMLRGENMSNPKIRKKLLGI